MKKLIEQYAAPFLTHLKGARKRDENITALWNRCHDHLIPNEAHLALPADEFHACPLCSSPRSVHIRADLRFGPDHWQHEASVFYCFDCRSYSLPLAERERHAALAQGDGAERRSPAYRELTAVDARLWSRTPTVLNLEPTTRCNFNCWYCIGRHMKQEDIDFDGFTRALDNFPTLKILALVGEGEPLLHKRFFDMVRLAKERGIRVVTISNGSPFSESVVRKLCEAEVDYISISIDSTDPATFAASRLEGDLDKVWEGIARLTKYRDANGYKYPLIGLKGTLFTHTKNEMPGIMAEAKRHGVDVVESFQALNPKTSYRKIYPVEHLALLEDYDQISEKICEGYQCGTLPSVVELAQRENMQISNSGRSNGLRKNCDEEWLYSLLSGDVTPCCQIKTPMDEEWNIFRRSVGDILQNHHYENVRFNLWNGIFPSACEGCSKTR